MLRFIDDLLFLIDASLSRRTKMAIGGFLVLAPLWWSVCDSMLHQQM